MVASSGRDTHQIVGKLKLDYPAKGEAADPDLGYDRIVTRRKGDAVLTIILWSIVGLVALIIVVAVLGYLFDLEWTGVSESRVQKRENEDVQRAKTLWDWLQLLIIPAVLALGGLWFTAKQEERQLAITDQREHLVHLIEDQRSDDARLQAYLDEMSQLLIDKGLRDPQEQDVRTVARAHTLTVLRGLDPENKRSVIRFVDESNLIQRDQRVLDLDGANLTDANLSNAPLDGTDLSGVDLRDANLQGANLQGADLSGADLRDGEDEDSRGANLSGANLSDATLDGANLTGAIMPDESQHE
jgi:hypothetical protein